MAEAKARRVLCPRCGRIFNAHVMFPYFRQVYLHQGESVYRTVCSDCRSIESSEPSTSCAVADAIDLDDQFEDLLDTVWRCEADWRLMDRLHLLDRQARRRLTSS